MRIIPFPGRGDTAPEHAWLAELDSELNGADQDGAPGSWRELREDVRALAPPMSREFEQRLMQRISERSARRPGDTPSASQARPRRGPRWARRPLGLAAGAALTTAIAVLAAILIAGPRGATTTPRPTSATSTSAPATAGAGAAKATDAPAASPVPRSGAPLESAGASSGRVQQLAASVSLAPAASEVQGVADRVSRLASSVGGFVQASHVQVQQGATSEATLTLKLPSAKLTAALASLAQLAPVRSQSQSLQDITDASVAARRRLADANAERRALLRALAQASTQGQIESLHERLAQAGRAIAEARSALQSISSRAGTAEVEVSVIGDAHPASEGLTLKRGLHDAGRVLVVALTVLLIAAAVLVPLALLLAGLLGARRAWSRYQRERALDAR